MTTEVVIAQLAPTKNLPIITIQPAVLNPYIKYPIDDSIEIKISCALKVNMRCANRIDSAPTIPPALVLPDATEYIISGSPSPGFSYSIKNIPMHEWKIGADNNNKNKM